MSEISKNDMALARIHDIRCRIARLRKVLNHPDTYGIVKVSDLSSSVIEKKAANRTPEEVAARNRELDALKASLLSKAKKSA